MPATPKTIEQLDAAATLTGAEKLHAMQNGKDVRVLISDLIAAVLASADASGTATAALAAHLGAFAHGDIAHANRAALDLISGTNTGDQDLSGYATTAALTAATPVSAATAPVTPAARDIWYNTVDGGIYQRNAANTAWVLKGYVDRAYEGISPLLINYTGNWVYSYPLLLMPIGAVQKTNSAGVTPSGKWINSLAYDEGLIAGGLQSLTFSDLKGSVSSIAISNAKVLVSLNYPELEVCGQTFQAHTLAACTAVTADKLSAIQGSLIFNTLPAITDISFPELLSIASLTQIISNASLATLGFPKLTTMLGAISLSTLPALVSLSVPELTAMGSNLTLATINALTALSFPKLKYLSGIVNISYMTALTSISFPAIVEFGSVIQIQTSVAAVTTVTFGATLKSVGGNVIISGCALTQASVDSILARLAALDGTNGTTSYDTKTVTITGTSATPSAAGLASKATLVARGCTVTHN